MRESAFKRATLINRPRRSGACRGATRLRREERGVKSAAAGPRRLENRSVKVKNFVSRVSISRSARGRRDEGAGNLCVTGGLSPSATLAATSGCGRGDCGTRNHCSKSPEASQSDGHSLTHGRDSASVPASVSLSSFYSRFCIVSSVSLRPPPLVGSSKSKDAPFLHHRLSHRPRRWNCARGGVAFR